MKRVAGPILVGLGVFLLALAILLPTVVVPRVEKAPLDQYSVSEATGTASYLDPTRLEFVEQDEVTVTRVVRGDVDASGDDVALYDVTQTVEVSQLDEPLNVVAEKVRLDRSSGIGVGGAGDRPAHDDTYTVKFPFNTERRDYEFHDAVAGRAYPVSFQGVTEVDGLEVYEFAGSVPEVVREEQGVPGRLVGDPGTASVFVSEVYTNDRTLLVEPRTGSIVSTTSSPRRAWMPSFGASPAAQETVLFEAEVEATDETVDELVSDAKDAKGQLDLLGRTLPIVLALLGLALLVAGAFLIARSQRPASGSRAATGRSAAGRGRARTGRDDGIDVLRG